ncbi:MAG: phosphodiesterase [Acholeplasmatales bacterium]|nr:phosphodiesterase [Acholeplasmatales bacterium]
MKYLIVSDIHGSEDSAQIIYSKFKDEKIDKILCLGDVLYHGPRNDLPQSYKPKEVISILNSISNNIICIKGNCEAEVDQMVLSFKILDSYDATINGINAHLEHGHHLDSYKGNPDIILYGHTHIPECTIKENIIYINPGSITIPKNGSKRGYAIWDNNEITLYTIDNEIVNSIKY